MSLREIIIDELFELSDYPSIYLAKSNYYFCKKMKEKKLRYINLSIGLKTKPLIRDGITVLENFSQKQRYLVTKGLLRYMQLMNTIPAEHEEKAEVIAKEVYTIGGLM